MYFMRYKKSVFSALLSALIFLFSVVMIINRQAVLDRVVLLSYTPPDYIVGIANKIKITESSRTVFYANKPELLEKEAFNSTCPVSEESIVLGCFTGRNIYIYNVVDERLQGVKEVTAAHELLHAEYDRISSSQRAKVNALIEKQLELLTDQRILKNIEAYRKKDPSVVMNEAHSILGTEVSQLLPELEDYYKKYFSDRASIVKLSDSYESVFTSLKTQVEDYDKKLTELKKIIDAKEANLAVEADNLISWSSNLDELRQKGDITNYNAQVQSYNASVENYRKHLSEVRSLIVEYNAIVEKRNQLSIQQNSLFNSINSNSKEL